MYPVQPLSKKPKDLKDLANDTSTDLSTQNGQLSSSSKEPKLNDEERLAKIKQELDRIKNNDSTDTSSAAAADIVKPGSTSHSFTQTDSAAQDDAAQTADKPLEKPGEKESSSAPVNTEASSITKNPPLTQSDINVNQVVPPQKEKGINLLNTALVVLGPLFLIGALGFSFYALKLKPQAPETYLVEMGKEEKSIEEIKKSIKKTLANAPLNPAQAAATCQSTGKKMASGQPSGCPDPLFTWSGEQTREPNTEIVGYWVYFGEKNKTDWLYYYTEDKNLMKTPEEKQEIALPIVDGKLQKSNQFEPSDLEKGKTYYLAVSAKSDSQNELWSFGLTEPDPENFRAKAAEILFTFIYE